jgi:hypothetical protein
MVSKLVQLVKHQVFLPDPVFQTFIYAFPLNYSKRSEYELCIIFIAILSLGAILMFSSKRKV